MKSTLFAAVFLGLAIIGCQGSSETAAPTDKPAGTTPPPTAAAGTGAFAPVAAVLTKNCVGCHSGPRAKEGIDLSSYAGVIKGGGEGPVVVAGDPAKSPIVMALHGQGKKQMPPSGALAADQIKIVEDWITAGAKE